ncbi:MAG: sodium:solute symporter [Salinivirgaceae bacterium]|nr:sodium:solute symporter [Salinivirgaceae bacterium]
MNSIIIIGVLAAYFVALLVISHITSRGANNESFFIGNRQSPWYLVAIAMIGTSISGVTFISVPGEVGASQFSYLQMVLGFFFGYLFIAKVLLPIYYKMQLTSIYTYLEHRFGRTSYKTGASFFLLSRIIGCSFRLFLMSSVLQLVLFDSWGIPFEITVTIIMLLILLYTFRGGIRTIVWTDMLQTLFMISALIITIVAVKNQLNLSVGEMVTQIRDSEYSRIWFFDNPSDKRFFFKQFLSGAFITIVMTGLDQDMMQKNLSCRNLADAQKNMYWYGAAFLPINLLFMALGAMLYIFAANKGIALPAKTDELYPLLASQYLPTAVSVLFIVGLVSAAYSSADSALTALTTSFSIDILDIESRNLPEEKKIRSRKIVHICIAVVVALIIIAFNKINDRSVISAIYTIAGYTYGPLLGLFAFGLFTKFQLHDRYVWIVSVASPIICIVINKLTHNSLGYELLMLNGIITFIGLLLLRKK